MGARKGQSVSINRRWTGIVLIASRSGPLFGSYCQRGLGTCSRTTHRASQICNDGYARSHCCKVQGRTIKLSRSNNNHLRFKRDGKPLLLSTSHPFTFITGKYYGVGVATTAPALTIQTKSRHALDSPAVSQIGFPSLLVPVWRTGTTHQRITCGELSVG